MFYWMNVRSDVYLVSPLSLSEEKVLEKYPFNWGPGHKH